MITGNISVKDENAILKNENVKAVFTTNREIKDMKEIKELSYDYYQKTIDNIVNLIYIAKQL